MRVMTDPSAQPTRDLGILALVLLGPIWGYGWVATKVALGYSQPLTFAALRVVLTALCLFLVLIVMRAVAAAAAARLHDGHRAAADHRLVGLVMVALHSGGAGKVAVLTYTMPFWLLLLAWAFLGEHLRNVQWLAVILAFAGLVLVVAPWQLAGVTSSLLTIAGGSRGRRAPWSSSSCSVAHHVDVISLTTWQMTIGALPLIVIAVLTYSGGPEWTAGFVWGLAYTVVLANAVAWVLWLYALRTLSAGAAGLGTLTIPVVGVMAAWLQLGEVPTHVEALGMILIVGGLAVLAAHGLTAGRREPLPPARSPTCDRSRTEAR